MKHTVCNLTKDIDVVETQKNPRLVDLSEETFIRDNKAEHFCLRDIIAQKLLPAGYQFKIFETYRSIEKQIGFWNAEIKKIKEENPDFSDEQIEEKANIGIANPYKIGSGHQTGAAVDLTLCLNKIPLDMGTEYLDTSNPKTPTFSDGLTAEQICNRKKLFSVMKDVGMVNYPDEWWHYSYGEQEWGSTYEPKGNPF